MRSSTSIALWRAAVVLLAVVAATQLAIELFHARRVLVPELTGTPLFEGPFVNERGPTRFRVQTVPATSPLKELGVVPGDVVSWDEPLGRWYNHGAGERITMTVVHGNESRRVEFTVPPVAALPRFHVAQYVMATILKIGFLTIGLLIGWRRPDLAAFRGLAAAALLVAIDYPYSAPAAAHLEWLDFVASVAQLLTLATAVFFAVNYPDDKPVGVRLALKRYYPLLYALFVASSVFYYVRLYNGYFEVALTWFSRAMSFVVPALFLSAIVLAFRQSRGESRVRLTWILATLGTMMSVELVGTLNQATGFPIPRETIDLVLEAITLVAMVGFVYAVLRRRIFDFGLAVNRTLVFAIVGAILLGIFQLAHYVASDFLRFDDKNKTLLLSAVLAVAVYLSFTQLKKHVEKLVDRVFFSAWAAKEAELSRFTKEASHATDPDALGKLLVAAVDRFTDGAGCAVYRPGNSFTRSDSTLASAPERVDANDETALALRAHGKAVRIRDTLALNATLALPMAHRGELNGFVLVGPQRSGDAYRPDQIEALESAVRQVGLDFYALKIEALENELAVEQRTAETLRAQLQTAYELQKTSRGNAPP